jgi:parallel beta-helix repeat protein
MTPVAYRHQSQDRETSAKLAGLAIMVTLPALTLWTIFGFGSYGYTIRPTAITAVASANVQPLATGLGLGTSRVIDATPHEVALVENGLVVRTMALTPHDLYGKQITLSSLASVVHDASWLSAGGAGHFTLAASLRVHGGLGLVAQAPAVTALTLAGPTDSFVSVAGSSTTSLSGLRIASTSTKWLGQASARPSIVFSDHATAYLSNVRLVNLGFGATNAWGLSFVDGATGSLDTTTTTGNDIGLYVAHSANLSVTNSTFTHSHLYGISLTRGAAQNTFVANQIVHNTAAGIVLSTGAHANTLTQNTVNRNGQTGVVLTSQSSSNTITQNSIESNKGDGLALTGNTSRNDIGGNIILRNKIGVVERNAPAQSLIQANVIEENALSLDGLSLAPGSNYVAKTGSAYRTLPPKKWSFLFPGLLLGASLPLVLRSYYLRKRDLRSFWQEIEGDDALSKEPPRSMRALYARWRSTRHLFVQMRDTSYPIGPILSLPMPTTPSYPIEEIEIELSARDSVTPRA